MDKKELAKKVENFLPTRSDLTKEKVETRAINIREVQSYIVFDIERHPGAGETQIGQPHTTLQTWRYNKDTSRLELVCEFARWYMDSLEQNKIGEPVCRHCGTILNRYEDVFGFIWRCTECGAIGGKEKEIFDPTIGEPLGDRADYKEKEDGLWVPTESGES